MSGLLKILGCPQDRRVDSEFELQIAPPNMSCPSCASNSSSSTCKRGSYDNREARLDQAVARCAKSSSYLVGRLRGEEHQRPSVSSHRRAPLMVRKPISTLSLVAIVKPALKPAAARCRSAVRLEAVDRDALHQDFQEGRLTGKSPHRRVS